MKRLSLSAVLLVVAGAGSALAGGGTQVSFSPVSASVTVGSAVAVDIQVANVSPQPGLAAYDLVLSFDATVVRLNSLTDTGFVSSGENLVICVTGQIDNVGGSVNANCTAIPLFGAPGVSTTEPVTILEGSFTALAVGTSPLTLSGVLAEPDGTPIDAEIGSGEINVLPATNSPAADQATIVPSATPALGALPATGGAASDAGSPVPMWEFALLGAAVAVLSLGLLIFTRHKRSRRA